MTHYKVSAMDANAVVHAMATASEYQVAVMLAVNYQARDFSVVIENMQTGECVTW